MDTRFWGPAGWKFLNSVVANHTPSPIHNNMKKTFVNNIPFVLPCKYCRASLTKYTNDTPLTDAELIDRDHFAQWLYNIHNKVNAKLREQGHLNTPDPIPEEGIAHILKSNDTFQGWDFLFSIAYNVPDPTDECKYPCLDPTDENEMRELNIQHSVPYFEKINRLEEFWNVVPMLLPMETGSKWIDVASTLPPISEVIETNAPEDTMKWVYTIYSNVESSPEPFDDIYKRVSAHSAKCNTGKTCHITPTSTPTLTKKHKKITKKSTKKVTKKSSKKSK